MSEDNLEIVDLDSLDSGKQEEQALNETEAVETRTDDVLDSFRKNLPDQEDKEEGRRRAEDRSSNRGRKGARGKNRRKKRKIWPFVVGAVLAVGAVLFILYRLNAARGPAAVAVYTVDKQDIVQSVQISGTVVTGEEKTYFSGVSVPVESLAVVAGDHVTEGQTLLTFSTERLDFTKTQAELKESAANGDYSSSMTKDAKSSADLAEANARLPELEQQILAVQETIDQYNIMIEEKQRRMAATGMELQKALIDSTAGTDEYQKLQLLVQENSYAQQNDQEVADWKTNVRDMEQLLAELKTQKSEMEAKKSSGEAGTLNAGAKQSLSANQQQNVLSAEDTISSVTEAQTGVVAEFDGVVTKTSVVEGQTVQQGTELMTIASTEDVRVEIQITKNDLSRIREGQHVVVTIAGEDFEGEVSRISGTATRNSNNVPVVAAQITLKNPNSSVILGVEANNVIEIGTAKDAIVLPYEYVNTDTDGDFVYVVEDGLIHRRPITVGLMSESMIEITEGLSAGELVAEEIPVGVEEGGAVTAIPADAFEGGAAAPAPEGSEESQDSEDTSEENAVTPIPEEETAG